MNYNEKFLKSKNETNGGDKMMIRILRFCKKPI